MKQIYSKITGTGSILPEKVITNYDIEKIVDTSHDWIVERTGIHERHIVGDGETLTDLAEGAAKRALEAANLTGKDIDFVIVGTCSGEDIFPSTACLLQPLLGISDCPAFDVSAACSGFLYAMSIADMAIKTGMAKNALVVGAEIISRYIDWKDRGTCILFGDGAGAIVLSASDEPGILSTHLHAAGEHRDMLYAKNNNVQRAINDEVAATAIHMKGNEVFKIAVKKLSEIVDETLAANNIGKSDIDWLIPHQANYRIIAATAKKLNMSMEQVVLTVGGHGNTSAASVPLALDTAVRDGRVKRGDTILFEALGGGLTWASALVKY